MKSKYCILFYILLSFLAYLSLAYLVNNDKNERIIKIIKQPKINKGHHVEKKTNITNNKNNRFNHTSPIRGKISSYNHKLVDIKNENKNLIKNEPKESIRIESKIKLEFINNFNKNKPGGLDGIKILKLLSFIKIQLEEISEEEKNYRIVYDIGANIGQTTNDLINYFSDQSCRDYDKYIKSKNNKNSAIYTDCIGQEKELIFYSFEPLLINFKVIEDSSKYFKWDTSSYWLGFLIGISNENIKNKLFYSNGKIGDQQASQDKDAGQSTSSINITLISIDEFIYNYTKIFNLFKFKSIGHSGIINDINNINIKYNIFLLKIDTEGYDYFVLKGANKTLLNKRVKFILFEYNDKWFTLNRQVTLKLVVNDLYFKYQYQCYFITSKILVPLFDFWWDDKYEIKGWSNVFCGIKNDYYLNWILKSYSNNNKDNRNLINNFINITTNKSSFN